jgi:hypothetical protein
MRRRVFEEMHHYFDGSFRDLGDKVWVVGLFQKNIRFDTLDTMTSSFTDTGENMNLMPNARREALVLRATAPAWMRLLSPLWVLLHRLRKLFAGHYLPAPFSYSIFILSNPVARVSFRVAEPTTIWRNRLFLRQ